MSDILAYPGDAETVTDPIEITGTNFSKVLSLEHQLLRIIIIIGGKRGYTCMWSNKQGNFELKKRNKFIFRTS